MKKEHLPDNPSDSVPPEVVAAIRQAAGDAAHTAVNSAIGKIQDASSNNSDFSAGVRSRGIQSRHGAQAIYDNSANNRMVVGMSFDSGQNSTYSIGQIPGLTTPYEEVFVGKAKADGTWYQDKMPIAALPPGTAWYAGEGPIWFKEEDGNIKSLPVPPSPGEVVRLGSIHLEEYKKYLYKFLLPEKFNKDGNDENKQERDRLVNNFGALSQIGDETAGFAWGTVIGAGGVQLEPMITNSYAIEYKKDPYFRFLNKDGAIIKLNHRGQYDEKNGSPYFNVVKKHVEYVTEKNTDGEIRFKRDANGFLVEKRKKYEKADGTGKPVYNCYLADPDRFDTPGTYIDDQGNEQLAILDNDQTRPVILKEGIMGRAGRIIDPRDTLIDAANPMFGYRYESISMENTRRIWSFKRTLLTYSAQNERFKTLEDIPEKFAALFSKETDAKTGQTYYSPLRQVQKKGSITKIGDINYRLVFERDFDAPRKNGAAQGKWYAYELDEENKPISEVLLPEIGMESDIKNYSDNPLVRHSLHQHWQGPLQNGTYGKQSDGVAPLARGIYFHGRVIERNRGRHMLKYLDKIKDDNSVGGLIANLFFNFGIPNKKDFTLNTKQDAAAVQQSEILVKARETSEFNDRAEFDGRHADSHLALWWYYSASRCSSDLVNGANRAAQAMVESTKVGTFASSLAGVSCLAMGITGMTPVAAVAVTAFVASGYLWNTMNYQHSRRRKDTITFEEIESHADTTVIFGKHKDQDISEVSLFKPKTKMNTFNTVGFQNDVYCALRGLFGLFYIYNGGNKGLDILQSKMSTNAITSAIAGATSTGILSAGLYNTSALATAFGLSTSLATTTALAVSGVGITVAATYAGMALIRYTQLHMSQKGEDFAKAMRNEYGILKPKFYAWNAIKPEDYKAHKDTFQRFGAQIREGKKPYTIEAALDGSNRPSGSLTV